MRSQAVAFPGAHGAQLPARLKFLLTAPRDAAGRSQLNVAMYGVS